MIRFTLCLVRDVIDVLYPPPPCKHPHYVSLTSRQLEVRLEEAEEVIASQAQSITRLRGHVDALMPEAP